MRILKIRLHNLHSIRSESLIDFSAKPLSETGLFAITGDTGAGKTTILDALTLALYGKICRKSDEKEVLSHGAQEGMAECEFEVKGARFLAQWGLRIHTKRSGEKKFRTDRIISAWNLNEGQFIVLSKKLSEVSQLVEEISGLDFPRFTRSVLLAQGEFAAFLMAPAKDRSDLLERITGTEIYSELSKAAQQRFRVEAQKLDDLNAKKDSLKVFTREELKNLKEEQELCFSQSRDLATRISLGNSAIQWIKDVQRLSDKLNNIQAGEQSLLAERESITTDLDKFELHQRTLPLHASVLRLDEKQETASRLNDEIIKLKDGIQKLEISTKQANAEAEQKNKELDLLKSAREQNFSTYEQVSNLDNQFNSKTELLTNEKTKLNDNIIESKQHSQSLKKEKQELNSAKSELQKLETWIEQNSSLTSLAAELESIGLLSSQLSEIENNSGKIKYEISIAESEYQMAMADSHRVKSLLSGVNEAITKLSAQFQSKLQGVLASSRSSLILGLSKEIELRTESSNSFNDLKSLDDIYKALLIEMAELEVEIENLHQEEFALGKQLLNSLEEWESLNGNLQFKTEIYNQQLRIANYEKDRSILKIGEPCPLCQSLHHPFRLHPLKPYVNEAELEMSKAKETLDRITQQQKKILHSQQGLISRISQLEDPETGLRFGIQSKIEKTEKEISTVLTQLSIVQTGEKFSEWLEKEITKQTADIYAKRKLRDELTTINEEIEKREKEKVSQELEFYGLEGAVSHWHAQVENLKKQELENAGKEETLRGQLSKRLQKYGKDPAAEAPSILLAGLIKINEQFISNSRRSEEIRKNIGLKEQSIRHITGQKVVLEKSIAKLEAAVSELEAAVTDLSKRRSELFGDKNPVQERQKYLKEVENAELAVKAAHFKFESLSSELKVTEASLNGSLKNLRGIVDETDKLRADLINKLAETGLENIDELRSIILSGEEVARIQEKVESLKQREIANANDKIATQKELKETKSKALTDKPYEEIEAELRELTDQKESLQQKLGAIKQRLEDNEAKKLEAKELLLFIDSQKEEYKRWSLLNDLIGSYDGKKFRIFAQGLTLQKLVQLANSHLSLLYGRYYIRKRPVDDLELDIVDTYQADHVRSLHTLSGGESFLVSLALALGLSDLAGKDANIKSLFIDEGFGSLDEQALDLAINTLENLQSKGKTIGIISHVKELKERISTQVRVVKKGGGVSTVEIIG